jgi:hypothetical protein
MFTIIHQNLKKRGTFVFATHDQGRPRAVHTLNLEDRILTHVGNNPATSTRRITAVEAVLQLSAESFASSACIHITCSKYMACTLMTTHYEWTSASGCCSNMLSILVSHL